ATSPCTTPSATANSTFSTPPSLPAPLPIFVVHINPTATGPIANTATVAASNPAEDANATNNSAMATTTAQRMADLAIAKSAPATACEGTGMNSTLVATTNALSGLNNTTQTD